MVDRDYGCNADDPTSVIAVILDNAGTANEIMTELDDLGFSVVRKDEIERLRLQSNENAEFATYWQKEVERIKAALRPFAELAGKLDGAPNLVGLLTEEDFRRAAEAFGTEAGSAP